MAPGPETSTPAATGSAPEVSSEGPGLDQYGLTKSKDGDRYFPIAIVGMGVRMPMSETVDEFRQVLEHEICAITPVPADRWSFNDFYTDDVNQRGHHCITKLGFCEKYYHFDPHYFNMSPREAQFMDPQHRQVMEVTDEALQDAGITPETLPKNTGVYIGMGIIDFPGAFVENRYYYNAHTLPGFTHTLAANRVSYNYGLTGPSCALDTACAASLTAIHVGCMSMWNKECEAAIVGATSNLYAPETTVAFSHLGVLSPNGNSAPFDVSNNGYVRGEGTGILVLKPMADAVRDNDHVYCVIRGTTSAHNGNSKSLTLPSADAQEELITRCYSQFGIPLEKVSFVEAHGTGTPVGDPIETVALGRTFGASRKEPLRIASAKSNFGHLEVAAGMVQVIKAAVMLDRRMMYKQIKWTAPNPRIDLEKLNLKVQTKQEPYTGKDNFIIGINTFGFGGSLVHMVFEEYKNRPLKMKQDQLAGWQFGQNGKQGRKIAITLSGKTKEAMRNSVQKWLQFKNEEDAQMAAAWQANRRVHHRERVVILADSSEDFRAKARAFVSGEEDDEVICDSVHPTFASPKICFIFSGYGQQWEDMGRRLYANEPVFKMVVDQCDAAFKKVTGLSALEKHQIFVAEGKGKMEEGAIDRDACKPAILFMQVAMYKLLEYWGVKPDSVMGVGLGEVTAALACGALTLEDAMKSMHVRMSAPPKDNFLKEMKKVLNGPKPNGVSFYSTITGQKYEGPLDADYWWKNVIMEGSKNFEDTIKSILKEDEKTTFVEIAGSETLLPLIKNVLREQGADSLAVPCGQRQVDDHVTFQKAVASLHCKGYKVDWSNITRNSASFVPVPLYGWDHQVIRLESIEYQGRRSGRDDRSFKALDGVLNFEKHAYLRDYILNDDYVFPTAGFVEFFAEHDDSTLSCLKDVSIKSNIKVEALHPDGFINDTKINVQKNQSKLVALDADNQLLAEATLAKARTPEKQPTIDLASIKSRCQKPVEISEQYDDFQRKGLTYARTYRILSELVIGDGEAMATIRGSKLRHERINTPFLDAAFQVALAAFNPGTTLYMPSDISQLQMFVPKIGANLPARVHAVLKEWSITHFVADITVTDEEGNVLIQITGLKAKSLTPVTSEVDLDSCLYTTKLQSCFAALPSTQVCEAYWTKDTLAATYPRDTLTMAWAEKNMGKLNKLASAHCRDVLKSLPEDSKPTNETLLSLMKTHAKSAGEVDTSTLANEILGAAPELSSEIDCLSLLAEQAQGLLSNAETTDGYVKSAAIRTLLNNSTSSRMYLSQCAEMLKKAVAAALEKKEVVRIGQIGCQSSALTANIVSALKDHISSDRVEYICTAAEDSAFGEIQNGLGEDLPKISYEVFDPATPIEEQSSVLRSFDILLTFDPEGHLQSHLPNLADLIADNGWLLLIEAVHNTSLLNLLLAGTRAPGKPLSEIQWCKALRKSGFSELRTLSSPHEMFFSAILGRKLKSSAVEKLSENDKWVLISNTRSELAKTVAAKLPGGSKVCGTVEFLATHKTLLREESKPIQIALLWDDETNNMGEVLQLVDILRNHERKESMKLWFVSQRSTEGEKSIHAAVPAGYLRAAANEEGLGIYIIELQSGKAEEVARDLTQAVTYHNEGDRELVFTEEGVAVPRITRLGADSQPAYTGEWVAQVSDSGVHCKSVTKSLLEPNQVRISVRGMAMQSFSADGFKAYAGVVEEVGAGVSRFNVGDAVMVAGLYSIGSRVVAPESSIMKKLVKLTWSQAAETLLNYTTAYHALVEEGGLEAGEVVLVYPPHTGLGQAAMQIAKDRGAKVICAMEQNAKNTVAVSRLGMMVMADPSSASFGSDLMDFTANSGVDIVFQSTKEDLPVSCLTSLAYGARICKTGTQHSLLAEASNAIVLPPLTSTLKTMPQRVQEIATTVAAKLDSGKYGTFTSEVSNVSEMSEKVQKKTQSPLDATYSFTVADGYVPSELQQPEMRLDSNATYMVSGAYGSTGTEVARWLADMGAKHVAMVDRTGCKNCFHKSTRRYIESQNDGTVYDIRADLSKKTDVEKVFKTLRTMGAPDVRGIFHVPLNMDDLSNTNDEVLSKMPSMHYNAGHNLHDVSRSLKQDLDYFVMFSSSDAAWGNQRQAGLCATHNALDALAENRRGQNLAGVSVQLGLVRGCGAIFEDDSLTAEQESVGMTSLHINEYLKLTSQLLVTPELPAVVTITNQDWTSTSASCHPNFLRISHLIRRGASGGALAGEDAGEARERHVREYIGGLTGSAPEDLDLLMPMQQFGVDSLMSQDIIAWTEKNYKVTIQQTDIFGGLTCAQLLARIQA